jgi:hypothetical protein
VPCRVHALLGDLAHKAGRVRGGGELEAAPRRAHPPVSAPAAAGRGRGAGGARAGRGHRSSSARRRLSPPASASPAAAGAAASCGAKRPTWPSSHTCPRPPTNGSKVGAGHQCLNLSAARPRGGVGAAPRSSLQLRGLWARGGRRAAGAGLEVMLARVGDEVPLEGGGANDEVPEEARRRPALAPVRCRRVGRRHLHRPRSGRAAEGGAWRRWARRERASHRFAHPLFVQPALHRRPHLVLLLRAPPPLRSRARTAHRAPQTQRRRRSDGQGRRGDGQGLRGVGTRARGGRGAERAGGGGARGARGARGTRGRGVPGVRVGRRGQAAEGPRRAPRAPRARRASPAPPPPRSPPAPPRAAVAAPARCPPWRGLRGRGAGLWQGDVP